MAKTCVPCVSVAHMPHSFGQFVCIAGPRSKSSHDAAPNVAQLSSLSAHAPSGPAGAVVAVVVMTVVLLLVVSAGVVAAVVLRAAPHAT